MGVHRARALPPRVALTFAFVGSAVPLVGGFFAYLAISRAAPGSERILRRGSGPLISPRTPGATATLFIFGLRAAAVFLVVILNLAGRATSSSVDGG